MRQVCTKYLNSLTRLLGRVSCDDLTVKDVLGKGGLARVLLVQTDVLKEGKGLNVALKCVFRPVLEDAQSLRAEAEIMERCSRGFDNIPKVLGWLESDTGLTGFLLQACGPPLQVAAATMDVAEFTRALRALSGAILHIHSMDLAHLDVKPPNLLSPRLSDLGMWRLAATDWMLADFDAALVFKRPEPRIKHRMPGTFFYASNEAKRCDYVGTMEDVYGFGISFQEAPGKGARLTPAEKQDLLSRLMPLTYPEAMRANLEDFRNTL